MCVCVCGLRRGDIKKEDENRLCICLIKMVIHYFLEKLNSNPRESGSSGNVICNSAPADYINHSQILG